MYFSFLLWHNRRVQFENLSIYIYICNTYVCLDFLYFVLPTTRTDDHHHLSRSCNRNNNNVPKDWLWGREKKAPDVKGIFFEETKRPTTTTRHLLSCSVSALRTYRCPRSEFCAKTRERLTYDDPSMTVSSLLIFATGSSSACLFYVFLLVRTSHQ